MSVTCVALDRAWGSGGRAAEIEDQRIIPVAGELPVTPSRARRALTPLFSCCTEECLAIAVRSPSNRRCRNAACRSGSGIQPVGAFQAEPVPARLHDFRAGFGSLYKPCPSVRAARKCPRACARAAASGVEKRRRDCAAVQRSRLGVACRASPASFDRRAAPVAGARRRAVVERRRDGYADGCDRAVEPVEFVPKRLAAAVPAAAPVASARAAWPRIRCAFAAGSATAFIGRCARPAPRPRSRRNILPLWRPRSTSATSRPNASFDMVLGPIAQLALRRAEPRRRSAICSWCGGMRTAAANGSTPPTPPSRHRSKAG